MKYLAQKDRGVGNTGFFEQVHKERDASYFLLFAKSKRRRFIQAENKGTKLFSFCLIFLGIHFQI